MKEMDTIPDEVMSAMLLLTKIADSEKRPCKMQADYENGKLIYENTSAGWKYTANVSGDSLTGIIKDWCRQIILKEKN